MANNGLAPKSVLVNGADLHYIEQGAGEPVIFVHGSLGDYRTWIPQLEAFSQKYRAISYSRRYHYPNAVEGNETNYSVSLHSNDLIGLIEALQITPAYVVGNSFGAYTTLLTATRRPDLLRKIVVGEPPMLPWLKAIPGGQMYWDDFMKQTWLPARETFQAGDLEQGVRKFVDGVSGKGDYDRLPEAVRTKFSQNAYTLKAETLTPDYFTEITPEQVERIQVPTLLLKGEKSEKMFHLIVDELARHMMKSARQVTISKAGHSIPSGNPLEYNQVVMDFIAS